MKNLVSGIQPTGIITLGNYLGAIKNFKMLQDNPDLKLFIFIADLHAITVSFPEKEKLRQQIRSLAAFYLACGLDSEKTNLFIQSEVKEHAELGYVMQCVSHIGELSRMTQYKEKKAKGESSPTGLLTYPTLMAADILLYDAEFVPVGDDQKQHLELTRDLAIRFNNRFGDVFKIPEPIIKPLGARIKSLTNPDKKMSKSDDNPKSYINMLETPAQIRNKIKSAVTDSDGIISFDPENKPGISNLLVIYATVTATDIKSVEKHFKDKSYAQLKEELAQVITAEIEPIQARYNELINSSYLDEILNKGRDNASIIAGRKLKKVYDKIGLGRKIK